MRVNRHLNFKEGIFVVLSFVALFFGMFIVDDFSITGYNVLTVENLSSESINGSIYLENGGILYLDIKNASSNLVVNYTSMSVRGNATDVVVDILGDMNPELVLDNLSDTQIFGWEEELSLYLKNCNSSICNVPIMIQANGSVEIYSLEVVLDNEDFVNDSLFNSSLLNSSIINDSTDNSSAINDSVFVDSPDNDTIINDTMINDIIINETFESDTSSLLKDDDVFVLGNSSNINSTLYIWDESDFIAGSKIVKTNENVWFYANYTNYTNSIVGANCTIYFNDSFDTMQYNFSLELYLYNRTFIDLGLYDWNVSCNSTGYDILNATDNITIYSNVSPKWSNNESFYPFVYNDIFSLFNITWIADNYSNISYVNFESNISGVPQNYSMTEIGSNLYQYLARISAGRYYWKSYSNDSVGNFNVTPMWEFEILKANTSGQILNNNSWTVNYTDNLGISYTESNPGDLDVSYSIYRDGFYIGSGENVSLGAGSYYYILNSSEGQNYSSNVLIDNKTLNVLKINSAVNLTLDGVDSNVTVEPYSYVYSYAQKEIGESNVSLYLDSILVNSSIDNVSDYRQFSDVGDYNITALYNETQNYTSSSITNFVNVRDQTKPNISIKTPLDSDIVGWTVLFVSNVTDNYNLTNVWYEIRNNSFGAIIGQGIMNDMGGGLYNATIVTNSSWPYDRDSFDSINLTFITYANDSSGNMNNESSVFVLDNTKPSIQFVDPMQSGSFYNNDFNLEIWLSNTKLNYSEYNITNSTGSVVQTNSFDISSNTYQITDLVSGSTLLEGNYTVDVYVKDYIGNFNNKTSWFYVDRTLPNVTEVNETGWIVPTPNNNTFTEITNHVLNFTCSDDYLYSAWIELNGMINDSLLNSANAYWWNFDVPEDTYYYTGYCNDSAGNVAETDERKITIDYNNPWVNLNSPSNNAHISSSSIGFRWTANDAVAPNMYCNLTIDGVLNVSNVTSANGVAVPIQTVSGFSEWWHTWNVSCWDDLNHRGDSVTRTFVSDITNPWFYSYGPINNLNTSYNSINFTVNVTDNIPEDVSCTLYINSASQDTKNVELNKTAGFYLSLVSDGSYNWYIRCQDLSGNNNQTITRSLVLDRVSPQIDIQQPVSDDRLGWKVKIFTNITDDRVGIHKAWYNIVNASNVSDIVYTNSLNSSGNWDSIWDSSSYPDGDYMLIVYANDTATNIHSENVTFRIDNSGPGIQFIYPVYDRYFNYSFNLNVSVNEPNLNNTYFNLTNETGYSYISDYQEPADEWYVFSNLMNSSYLIEGNYTINITSENDSGAKNSKDYWFMMDIFSSRLSEFISNDTDNITRSDSLLNYSVFVEDKFIENVSIEGFDMSGFGHHSTYSEQKMPQDLGCVSEGLCTVTIDAYDFMGNFESIDYNMTIDNNNPVIVHNTPIYYLNTSNNTINFSWTVTDSIDVNPVCNLSIDDEVNISDILTQSSVLESAIVSGFSEGYHSWNVTCWDEISHFTTSNDSIFVNDYTDPYYVNLDRPFDISNISSTQIYFNWTSADNLDPEQECNLIVDGIVNKSRVLSLNDTLRNSLVSGFSEGYHNWSVECFDDANNSNISENRDFLVDITAPQFDLHNPVWYENISSYSVNFNWTAWDSYDNNLSCNLSVDGVVNKSGITHLSGSYQNITVNGFSEDYHTWKMSCVDDSGNFNESEERQFTIDRTAPNIDLVSPVESSNISNSTIYFSWYTQDMFDPEIECSVYIDDILNSTVMVNNDTVKTISIDGIDQGYHYWNVSCIDDSGNLNVTSALNFLVDRNSPVIVLNSPMDNFNTTFGSVSFNWSVSDNFDTLINCDLFIDSVVNISGIQIVNASSVTRTVNNLAEGVHTWNVSCNDDSFNQGNSSVRNFRRDITPPLVSTVAPLTDSINGWTVVMRGSSSDIGVGVDKVWYEVYNESLLGSVIDSGYMVDVGAGIYEANISTNRSWPYDAYTYDNHTLVFRVYSNDTLGNVDNGLVEFLIDNKRPGIQIFSPIDGYRFFNNNFSMDVLISNTKLNYSNYSIFNGISTVQSNFVDLSSSTYNWNDEIDVDSFGEGNHSLDVYVKDFIDNENNKSSWFYVDKTSPNMTIDNETGWSSPTPLNDTYYNFGSHILNFSCSDMFYNDSWIDLNGTINSSLYGSGLSYYWNVNLSEGTYKYRGYCDDFAGNIGETDERTIHIDYSNPVWNNNVTYPLSGVAYVPVSDYQFNVTWDDNYDIVNVIFETNFSGSLVNQTATGNVLDEYYLNVSDLAQGRYVWRVYAYDSSGRMSMTDQWNYIVDYSAAVLNLTLNLKESDIYVNQSEPVNITGSLVNPLSGYIELYQDSVMINNGTDTLSNITLYPDVGVHNITVYYPRTHNYSSGVKTYLINVVDNVSANVSLISPDNLSVKHVNTTFEYFVEDLDSDIKNCSLLIDSLEVDYDIDVNKSIVEEINSTNLPVGNHTWQVKCIEDNVNFNRAYSEIRNITFLVCTDYDNDSYWDGGCEPKDCDDNNSLVYPGASCSRSCYSGSTYDSSCACTGGSYTCGGGGGNDDTEEEPVDEEPVDEEPIVEEPIDEEPDEEIEEQANEDIIEEEGLEEDEVIEEVEGVIENPEVLVPAEEVVFVDPETGEVKVVPKYSKGQIVMIKRATSVDYKYSNDTKPVGEKQKVNFSFKNKGNKALEDVSVGIDAPNVTNAKAPYTLHTKKIFGWDILSLTGWAVEDYLRDPDLLQWKVSEPKTYKLVKPGENLNMDIDYQSPVVYVADFVDLFIKVKSRGQDIYSEKLPVKINTTEFRVVADPHIDDNVVDVYLIVSNQKNVSREFNVELNINKKEDEDYTPSASLKGFFESVVKGKRTVVAEYYGPYVIPAKETQVFSYRYRYSPELAGDYELSYGLYEDFEKIDFAKGEMQINNYLEVKAYRGYLSDYTKSFVVVLMGILLALSLLLLSKIESGLFNFKGSKGIKSVDMSFELSEKIKQKIYKRK